MSMIRAGWAERIGAALKKTMSPMHTEPRLATAMAPVRTSAPPNIISPDASQGQTCVSACNMTCERRPYHCQDIHTYTQLVMRVRRTAQSAMTISYDFSAHAARRGGLDQTLHDHLCTVWDVHSRIAYGAHPDHPSTIVMSPSPPPRPSHDIAIIARHRITRPRRAPLAPSPPCDTAATTRSTSRPR